MVKRGKDLPPRKKLWYHLVATSQGKCVAEISSLDLADWSLKNLICELFTASHNTTRPVSVLWRERGGWERVGFSCDKKRRLSHARQWWLQPNGNIRLLPTGSTGDEDTRLARIELDIICPITFQFLFPVPNPFFSGRFLRCSGETFHVACQVNSSVDEIFSPPWDHIPKLYMIPHQRNRH